ncbi:MAG: sensor histidine kinase [Treponemataceae bacterium]
MKSSLSRAIANLTAFLAACALTVSGGTLVFTLLNRDETVRLAEAALSREAGVVGEHFDGIFRTTSVVLSNIVYDGGNLTEYALAVPEASNFLILDQVGRPLKTAYPRPRLVPIFSPLQEKIRNGSHFEAGAVMIPFEGDRSLALLARRESQNGAYAGTVLAVFSDRVLDNAIAALLGTAITSLYLEDVDGTILLFRSRTKSNYTELKRISSLFGTYQLRTLPLRLFVVAERDELLAPQYRFRLTVAVIAFVFSLVLGFMCAYAVSMTRGIKHSEELARELERRDSLFREVHHRVKNDLQIVRSVIALGRSSVDSVGSEADNALCAAEARINSISLVHEQLYKQAAVATTDLSIYISDLASHVTNAYGGTRPIQVSAKSESGLSLSIDAAVPCGLLLNELVTNAFKYAFPNGRSGVITIGAKRVGKNSIELRVEDDGIGFVDDLKKLHEGSFGLELIKALCAQLGATLKHEGGPGEGTRWIITLPPASADLI